MSVIRLAVMTYRACLRVTHLGFHSCDWHVVDTETVEIMNHERHAATVV